MDQIKIENLKIYAYHGVFPEEKEKGQTFYINAILDLIDKYNSTISEEYQQLDIYDVLNDIDDLENEQDIKRAIKELEMRVR